MFRIALRQTEGFVGSLLNILDFDHLPVPDHSTLSRRARSLDVLTKPTRPGGPIHLIVDSTGLQILGEGPWAAAKHGTKRRREWRKLHVAVDGRGFIVAHCLTERRADDASVVGELLSGIRDEVERSTADGAYEKTAVYDLLTERGTDVVSPPKKNARVSRHGPPGVRARNVTVESVRELGPRAWKKQAGYPGQSRVENAFYRYKQLIGGRPRGRNYAVQATEVGLAINVLDRMLEPGAPRSAPIHN